MDRITEIQNHVARHVAAGYKVVQPVTVDANGEPVAILKRKGKRFQVGYFNTYILWMKEVA